MERDYFIFKSQVGFGIASDDLTIDPLEFTDILQLKPTNFHIKGDTFIGKHTGIVGIKPRTVWTIDSERTESEEETISHHIEYFKGILLPKADLIKKYKADDRLELSFWISIETDNAGAGFYLLDDELAFLNEFSNWIHISVIVKEFDDTPR